MDVNNYETYPLQGQFDSYVSVYFRYTTKAFEDERSIYGILAFLSDVGGFIQSFVFLGSWLVSDSTKHKYFTRLLNKMYHVKQENSLSAEEEATHTMTLSDLHKSQSLDRKMDAAEKREKRISFKIFKSI